MKKFAVALAVLVSMTSSAFAAEGPLLARFRRVYVEPANLSSENPLPKNAVHVEDKTIPEVDFTYFILPNVAAELILTHPQKHGVTVGGADYGSVTILPPCLTVQYHFLPDFAVRPYVGVGANLTLVTAQDLNPAVHIKPSRSFGVVGQVGADLKVTDHVFINADLKYVTMSFDVKFRGDGSKAATANVNPLLWGLGVGYRL